MTPDGGICKGFLRSNRRSTCQLNFDYVFRKLSKSENRKETRRSYRLLDASVAVGAAGICKLLSRFRDELPVVSPGPQPELQNTVSIGIARFAVRHGKQDRPVILAAGAHHEFANTAG